MRALAAVVNHKGGDFSFAEIELDAPRADEVLVRIVAVGLCQTDVHVRNQDYPVPLPLVLGHEGSGVVVQVGAGVSNLKVGDKVVLSFPSCGQCQYCLAGQVAYCAHSYELCFGGHRLDGSDAIHRPAEQRHLGTIHGYFFGQSSFASYAIAAASGVVKVADDIPLELLGPLGCGLQTGAGAVLNSLQVREGSSVAVFGSGAVGLAAIMAAKIAGASVIIAVDIRPERLHLARELGATHSVLSDDDLLDNLKRLVPGGIDYVLEVTARPEMLGLALDSLAPQGVVGLLGGAPTGTKATLDMNQLLNGRSVRGIIQGDAVPQLFIPKLMQLHRAGLFPFDKLIRFYDFSQINQAVADTHAGVTIKAVLRLPEPAPNPAD
jgi:aryl-alcohol dehydrogenase